MKKGILFIEEITDYSKYKNLPINVLLDNLFVYNNEWFNDIYNKDFQYENIKLGDFVFITTNIKNLLKQKLPLITNMKTPIFHYEINLNDQVVASISFNEIVIDDISGIYIRGFDVGYKSIGLGRQIINEIFNICKIKNINYILLESEKSAIGFWEKMGFNKIKDQNNNILMKKEINA
ncbi:GNAT family N-acetyltransferase [Candidatus Dojkabacteria bacterium]|jgi:ribosomal protein S18 acetylase RimI-like enzyme|nr:GNAT family N-acetyltransferase [Candidatus Dojkabacteria bacterium]